jgi:para-aminobenzoate synthetase/4-amino-4-deoxychorismate lyase
MRMIHRLEPTARGVYTGAIGYLTPQGDAVFSVAIRTATIDTRTGRAVAGVGGGITWESNPAGEYAEAMRKATFLETPVEFDLLETMRLDDGGVVRLDRHLARLAASAAFLGFDCDLVSVRRTLVDACAGHPTGTRRVRLTLTRAGRATVELSAADRRPSEPVPVVLASAPVSSPTRSLYHKTTDRSVYDRARAECQGVFDVLLWNERREVTEFAIGNVVVELEGARYTPPRSCGLLAGVFRSELLDSRAVSERVVTLDELEQVSRIWLVNSLRDWIEVRLLDSWREVVRGSSGAHGGERRDYDR